jgi:hypothetical protein
MYAASRKRFASRPYLYDADRPAISFVTAMLIYFGLAAGLSVAFDAYRGDSSAISSLFARPYLGVFSMFAGACAWWREQRNWKKFVVDEAEEMMLGPIAERELQK